VLHDQLGSTKEGRPKSAGEGSQLAHGRFGTSLPRIAYITNCIHHALISGLLIGHSGPEPVVFCCAFGLKLPPNRHKAVGALGKAVSILSATLSLTTFAHSQAERYDALANSAMFENRSASLIGRLGQALSGYPPAPVRCGSRARASLRIRHKALPIWDSKTRWNNLSGGLAVSMTAGPSGQTISPHPSSREGHHSTAGWSSISSYRI